MPTNLALARQFLDNIWGRQPRPKGMTPFIFLAQKDFESGTWSDLPNRYTRTGIARPSFPLDNGYFCPNFFGDDRRLRKNALPGRWLYADLDEVDPRTLPDDLRPTLAWETSPGRYQAAWLLTRPQRPRSLERLNQSLTYATGADKGGWSLTKVLRFPGSISTKHGGEPFTVRLIRIGDENSRPPTYDPADLAARLPDPSSFATSLPDQPLPSASDLESYATVYRRYRRTLTPRTRTLLNTRNVVGGDDRSAKLYELQGLLLEAGVPPQDVLVLVRATVWNKYRGQDRELRALWGEITKHRTNVTAAATPTDADDDPHQQPNRESRDQPKSRKPKLIVFRDFMTTPLPRPTWLVEGIWSESAHGMLAGEPKSLKSLFTLDLAVSIASGTPFLNHFAVPSHGPVIVIQEENTPGDVHDRLLRIASSRGLGPAVLHAEDVTETGIDFGSDLPIHLLNNEGFSLTDETWMRWLERQIRVVRPALVVLDPLYLMARGVDENSANEMTPILTNLLRLKQRYGCGIQIVHHYHKPKEGDRRRMAHRISGSGVFHRWLASAIYVERPDENVPTVYLSGEHRSHGNAGSFKVEFDLGTDSDVAYGVKVTARNDEEPDDPGDVEVNLPDRLPRTLDEALAWDDLLPVNRTAKALGITPTELKNVMARSPRAWTFDKLPGLSGRPTLHAIPTSRPPRKA